MVRKLKSQSVTWVSRWEVNSRTTDKTYVVAQKSDGSWGCACGGWIFNKERPRKDCAHIEKVKQVEGVVDATPTPTPMIQVRRGAFIIPRRSDVEVWGTKEDDPPVAPAVQPRSTAPIFVIQKRRTITMED
jgi:hypothetical protein